MDEVSNQSLWPPLQKYNIVIILGAKYKGYNSMKCIYICFCIWFLKIIFETFLILQIFTNLIIFLQFFCNFLQYFILVILLHNM